MSALVWTEYNRKAGIVTLHGEDGSHTEVPVDAFDDPIQQAQILAQFDTPPPPEKSDTQKLIDVLVQKKLIAKEDLPPDLAVAATADANIKP